MNRRFFVLLLLFGFGIFLCDLKSGYAQSSDMEEFTLEEITVTAQKRAENQQKVAIAMEVMSGDELKELGSNDIAEILQNVSNVVFNKDADGLRVSIRGMADDKPEQYSLPTTAPVVALNTDGVFSNRKSGSSNLYDVERVEVLFGPQSTLYASTSFGGVINVVTGTPKTDSFDLSGTLEYGNYNLLHMEGYVNAPVSSKMAVRAAFSASAHDGYVSNGMDDEDMKSARVKTLFQPNDKLSLLLTGEIEKNTGNGSGSVVAFKNQDDRDDPWTAYSSAAGSTKDQVSKKIFANIAWDMGFGTLTIVPAYSKKNFYTRQAGENMEGVFVISDTYDNGEDKGLEGRLASSEGSVFKWIVGINWYKSSYVDSMTGSDDSWRINTNIQTIKAAYGNVTYPVTNQLRLTGGLRYSDDSTSFELEAYPDMWTRGYQYEKATTKYKDPDYKIGFEYDLGENSMLFLDYSTSYRTNKGEDSEGNPLDPETLDAYSLGSKNRFLGNKLQLNATAYYYQYKNYLAVGGGMMRFYQLTDLDGDGMYTGDGEAVPFMDEDSGRQIGNMEVYGLDLQTSTIITNNDKLDLSVSYSHSEWTKLYFDFPQTANDWGIEDLDYVGKGKPFDPHLTMNASYNHNFNLANGGTLTGRLDVRYQSSTFMSWAEEEVSYSDDGYYTPQVVSLSGYRTQEAYYLGNISGIYADPTGKWTFTGYVKNFTNYAVKQSGGTQQMMIGAPRTYGAVLTVRY